MKSFKVYLEAKEYGPRPKLRRDITNVSDDQKYICDDPTLIEKHKLIGPFECGILRWQGAGMVTVEFYSPLDRTTISHNQSTDYTFLKWLRPIVGETWDSDVAKWHNFLDQ